MANNPEISVRNLSRCFNITAVFHPGSHVQFGKHQRAEVKNRTSRSPNGTRIKIVIAGVSVANILSLIAREHLDITFSPCAFRARVSSNSLGEVVSHNHHPAGKGMCKNTFRKARWRIATEKPGDV